MLSNDSKLNKKLLNRCRNIWILWVVVQLVLANSDIKTKLDIFFYVHLQFEVRGRTDFVKRYIGIFWRLEGIAYSYWVNFSWEPSQIHWSESRLVVWLVIQRYWFFFFVPPMFPISMAYLHIHELISLKKTNMFKLSCPDISGQQRNLITPEVQHKT